MVWKENLYLGKSVAFDYRKRKRQITKRKAHPFVYLIILSAAEPVRLEIISSGLLLQKAYPTEKIQVVGMAASRPEAFELVRRIVDDVAKAGEGCTLSEFFDGTGDMAC